MGIDATWQGDKGGLHSRSIDTIGDCRKKGKINQKRQTKEWEAIGRSRY